MSLTIKRFTVDNISWTAITAPRNINAFALYSDTDLDLKIRSVQADANTEKTLKGGSQETVVGAGYALTTRWKQDDVICYVQQVDVGSSTAVLTTTS